MANIPITLTPLAVPVGIEAINFDQLLTLISQYVGAQISADVSFFVQGSNWPLSDQGIFFNQTTAQFGTWNTGQGKYLPITDLVIGDMKSSFVAGDNTADGWIQLDGRSINAVTGINQDQKSALEGLFGANANLPNYTFLSGLSNLPADGSFSGVDIPAPDPSQAAIGALPIGSGYDQDEVAALRNSTAVLAGSNASLNAATAQIRGYAESMLNSLNAGGVAGPKWFVYAGSQ